MTLRIREVVIRAEIGDDTDPGAAPKDSGQPPETVSRSETGSLTLRFYGEDSLKVNDR